VVVNLEKLRDNFHYRHFHILMHSQLEYLERRSFRIHLYRNLMGMLVMWAKELV